MSRRIRLFPALVLLLALIAPALVFAGAAPPSPGGAALTIHSRFCPDGYEGSAVFDDCHGTIGSRDLVFSLDSGGGPMLLPLNDEGNIAMTGLEPGVYILASGVPDELIYGSLFCSVTGRSELVIPTTRTGDNRFRFVLDEGDDILCDWYSTPYEDARAMSAQVEIHSRTCPVDWAGDDIFEDCHGTVGSVYSGFGLEGAESRYGGIDDDGNLMFTWLERGNYTLFNDISAEHSRAVVYCSQRDDMNALVQYDVYESEYGGQEIEIRLRNGDDLICDWYTLPDEEFFAPNFAFPITVYTCDSDPGAISPEMGLLPDDCAMQAGARVTVKLTEENRVLGSCMTNASGVCTVMTPSNVRVTVTIALASLPAGYAPRTNPVETVVFTEFAGAVFVLLPS